MATKHPICCGLDICICGEAYRSLSDAHLGTLAQNVVRMLNERLVAASPRSSPVRIFGEAPEERPSHTASLTTLLRRGRNTIQEQTLGDFDGDRYSFRDLATQFPRPVGYGSDQRSTLQMSLPRRGVLTEAYTFTGRDHITHPHLTEGTRFLFLVGAGDDFTGEWVVTGITVYDEENGPKLQVASVKAQRGEQEINFFTSYNSEMIDETMVPFVSMEHIKILPTEWDIVEEPAEHAYKKLKVGSKVSNAVQVVGTVEESFTITKLVFRQKNYGLCEPDKVAVVMTVEQPHKSTEEYSVGITIGVVNWILAPWDSVNNLSGVVAHIDMLAVDDVE